MCFSATASFIGSAAISSIGIAALKKVKKPSQMVFASVPLIFGVQQLTEGFLWLTIPNSESIVLSKIFSYIFLVTADVIWPIIIPFSVLLMEEKSKRKKVIQPILLIGILLASYYLYCLIRFNINPMIVNYHIQYNTEFPKSYALSAFIIYLVVTITPLFVSSIQRIHYMGILMFLSCVLTVIFYQQYLTSVWCFFAALISGIIYWIVSEIKINLRINQQINMKRMQG